MRARTWSIRRRLLVWLLTPMLLVCTALLVDAWYGARRVADRAYDRLLAASAQAIAERVLLVDGALDVDLPYVALDMLSSQAQDRVFYRVTGLEGEFITGYRDLPPPPAHLSGRDEVYYDAWYRGEWVRVAVLVRPIAAGRIFGRFRVQVAQTRGDRNQLARELVVAAALRLLALVVLAASIVWFGIRRGLAPLDRLQQSVLARSPRDLTPIDDPAPREVRHLVAAINRLMSRLAASLAAMQRFIADASHQLRTPLAGLQAQTELLLRQPLPEPLRESLTGLHLSTCRTSRLAGQLLSLARAAPDNEGPAPEPVNLAALAAAVTRERVPAALARGQDLGFEGGGEATVRGDPLLLQELITNLVENALRYCPAGSILTVRVAAQDQKVLLEVEDDGPGIPAGQRRRVLERFYRIPGSGGEGSGLGLAIVKEIADRHGARLSLDSGAGGRGLRVRLVFPRGATD